MYVYSVIKYVLIIIGKTILHVLYLTIEDCLLFTKETLHLQILNNINK